MELAFREAVCPTTIPNDVPREAQGAVALSDKLLLDGWSSVKRVSMTVPAVKRMSVKLGSVKRGGSIKNLPPAPPKPLPMTEEVALAIEKAKERKASFTLDADDEGKEGVAVMRESN